MRPLESFNQLIIKARAYQQLLSTELGTTQEKQVQLETDLQDIEQVQALIQTVAQQTQEQLRFHIRDIVQLALDTCFPGEYEFSVQFEIKRGQTEARLSFIKEGQEINPLDASGGGAVDLASFALRIAAWTLGKTDAVIVLDEPFRFLSKDLQPRAGEIMVELSRRLGIQFIVVTHNPDIVEIADRTFEVSLDGRVSRVKEGV